MLWPRDTAGMFLACSRICRIEYLSPYVDSRRVLGRQISARYLGGSELVLNICMKVGNVEVDPPIGDKSDGLGEAPADVTLSDIRTEGCEPVGITNWERYTTRPRMCKKKEFS